MKDQQDSVTTKDQIKGVIGYLENKMEKEPSKTTMLTDESPESTGYEYIINHPNGERGHHKFFFPKKLFSEERARRVTSV